MDPGLMEQARAEQDAFFKVISGDPELGDYGFALFGGSKTLSEGSTGNDVTKLQKELGTLGYNTLVTGSFGPQTTSAVKEFQRLADLPSTGVVDKATQAAIDLDLRAGGAKTGTDLTSWLTAGTSVVSQISGAGTPAPTGGRKRPPKKEGMPSWVIPVAVVGGIVVIGGGALFLLTRK